MADDKAWWGNRLGDLAPVSNPQSSVPNYALTVDMATAPWQSAAEFQQLAESLQAQLQHLLQPVQQIAQVAALVPPEEQRGGGLLNSWQDITDVAGTIAGGIGTGIGAAMNVLNPAGWVETAEEVAEGTPLDEALRNRPLEVASQVAEAPVVEQMLWVLEKANEYGSTALLASAMTDEDIAALFKGETWATAHRRAVEENWTVGEALVMDIFYSPETLSDEEKVEAIRRHNTLFNTAALAGNVFLAYKFDPSVLAGRGLGAVRDVRAGRLSTDPESMRVERDVLAQPTREEAAEVARSQPGLRGRVRGARAMTLYDKAEALREAARTLPFEDFVKRAPFQRNAAGFPLAKLMKDVADDDEAWNLLFRSSIGDPDALPLLMQSRVDVLDKIEAIEARTLPALEGQFERAARRYERRLAETNDGRSARAATLAPEDKWLEWDMQELKADLDAAKAKLARYEEHESWLQRALTGFDPEVGIVSDTARNQVFGSMNQLNPARPVIDELVDRVRTRTWRNDEYSPVSRVINYPASTFQKRLAAVDLNDSQAGGAAMVAYLDQLAHVTGVANQAARDAVLERWAAAASPVERHRVVEKVTQQAVNMVGQKHGLSPELMDRLGREIASRRQQTWTKMSDAQMWSPIKDGRGRKHEALTFTDEFGNTDTIRMPISVTQMPNYFPVMNLTDLDRMILQNRDLLRDLDANLGITRAEANAAKLERVSRQVTDTVGTVFNRLWKPATLLSIRWPLRVVSDEAMRVMLVMGVLPHVARATEGAGNLLYNNGFVKPMEFVKNRFVKTRLAEDATRVPGLGADRFDYRAAVNPSGAVPAAAVDLGSMNRKRHARVLARVSADRDELDAYHAAVWRFREAKKKRRETAKARLAARKPGEVPEPLPDPPEAPVKPRWAQAWDDRVAAFENHESRGFFFSPTDMGRVESKGFAVSPYPGRMRTFDRRPAASDVNNFMRTNAELLSIPTNRVAAWLDRDTGRWTLDVVKTYRRREDAMQQATALKATEFYDIEDGFTRYLSEEDFWGHAQAAEELAIRPATPNNEGLVDYAVDFDPPAVNVPAGQAKRELRKVGFGTTKWRTRDGRTVEGTAVFGESVDDPNIYLAATSSNEAMMSVLGATGRSLSDGRRARQAGGYRLFQPEDDGWADAYVLFANRHMRHDPIWSKMLHGQTDEQIEAWLRSKAGRAVRREVGPRGADPHKWVSEMREVFDHMFPTPAVRAAARDRDLTPGELDDLIPFEMRDTVHGDEILMANGTHPVSNVFRRAVEGAMGYLATVPTDVLVRHPFAANVYENRMRAYIASLDADQVTPQVLAAAEASARGEAVRQVRRYLYSMADETEAIHALRFVSPFFQAQMEVLQRYGRVVMDKPETIGRMVQLFEGSQRMDTPFWEVVDKDGNPAEGYDRDNQVVIQVRPWMRGLVNKVPGLKRSLDHAGAVTIPVASLNMVLEGDMPFVPSAGPLVTVPVSEFVFKDRPELSENALYRFLFPYGEPVGENPLERGLRGVVPAWARRLSTALTQDQDDPAFARRAVEIHHQRMLDWESSGKQGPPPSWEDTMTAASGEYFLRAFASFNLPVPVTPVSPYKMYQDIYNDLRTKHGPQAADRIFSEQYPDFFDFVIQTTKVADGMAPTVAALRNYKSYGDLPKKAPLLSGVLANFGGLTGDFSQPVYQWQLRESRTPGSTEKLRERMSAEEISAQRQIRSGWMEYGKIKAAVDAELRFNASRGGSMSLSANSNWQIRVRRNEMLRELFEKYPAWQDEYNARADNVTPFLREAYSIADDKRLDGRPDIEGLRAYLISRKRMQGLLLERANATGGSARLSYDATGAATGDNADLALAWESYVNELIGQNPMFAEIYHRYLDADDLSGFIAPDVTSGW